MNNHPLLAFHIDMNLANFRGDYLKQYARRLAELGYNAILWEVENKIEWETVPECVAPEAFSKKEFRDILDAFAKEGLQPIPLLQTLGHAEYVLNQPAWQHLSETDENHSQYCPLHPDVTPLLKRWIDEYLDLFGAVETFHIGADECRVLGSCPKCSAFVRDHSHAELYARHIVPLLEYVRSRGPRPALWSDMILSHPEMTDCIPRDALIFDWDYYPSLEHRPCIFVRHGQDHTTKVPFEPDPRCMDLFGKYLYDTQGDMNVFYGFDYLVDQGFDVVASTTSACYEESVFAPNMEDRLHNAWDYCGRGMEKGAGLCMTSWTVNGHPWEIQAPIIGIPPFRMQNPNTTLDHYRDDFCASELGASQPEFWKLMEHLSVYPPGAASPDLGFGKDNVSHFERLWEWAASLKPEERRKTCAQIAATQAGYQKARKIICSLPDGTMKEATDFALRHLEGRAKAMACLLDPKATPEDTEKHIALSKTLQADFEERYCETQKKGHAVFVAGFIFKPLLFALSRKKEQIR